MDQSFELQSRDRKLTEKGLSYNLDLKSKERIKQLKLLDSDSTVLASALKGSDKVTIKNLYKDWLFNYDGLLSAHYDYQKLLDVFEQETDDKWFQTKNDKFIGVKNAVECWFLENASVAGDKQSIGSDRKSQISFMSRSSKLSEAKLKETQRKVELQARASALVDKRKIEEEKLKLKMREEELNIKTEMEVSEAKVRIIEELERNELQDRQIDDLCTEKPVKDYDNIHRAISHSELNPNAQEWVDRCEFPEHHGAAVNLALNQQSSSRIPVRHRNMLPDNGNLVTDDNDKNGILTVARELNKPKAEIQAFDGNPMHYNRFLRQFKVRVENNTDSFEERLSYLLQFTTGEANKIVSGYSHLNAERGYIASMTEFQDRYGDPDVIAHAYVQKALDWPMIKNDSAKALDEFSIFLRECQYAVENVQSAKILEYPDNIKTLVKKLPFYMHDRWRTIVYDIKERKGLVKFKDLVDFVTKEAKKVVDPVYGKEGMGNTGFSSKLHVVASRRPQIGGQSKLTPIRQSAHKTMVSAVSESSHVKSSEVTKSNQNIAFAKPCLFCQDKSHALNNCNVIKERPLTERYAFLKSKGLCFACLMSGHLKVSCMKKLVCTYCNKSHPSILHVAARSNSSNTNHQSAESSSVSSVSICNQVSATLGATHMGAGEQVRQALPIVPVRLKSVNSDKYIETYAFLDSGSTATFCSERVTQFLNVEGKRTRINLHTLGQDTVEDTCSITGLEICSLDGKNVVQLPPVFTQPKLPVSTDDLISFSDLKTWPHLKDVPILLINSSVDLLIGINVPKAIEPFDVIPSVDGGPFAVKTRFGWVINGPLGVAPKGGASDKGMFVNINRIGVEEIPTLEDQVRNQFNHDFNERTLDDVPELSLEDSKFMNRVSKSIKLEDGHYTIGLPFKSETLNMPNNRGQAEQRLASLAKRFIRDDNFHHEYVRFMNKVFDNNYACKVPLEKLEPSDGKVWYLPHHGVYHLQKHKIRVVFDCAANFQGTSLNEQLLQGPNLTNTLFGTLTRFRQEEIAVMGDIESMFYQVRVPPDDANFLRFLWYEDGDYNKSVIEYQMLVHLFGATSSPSCANFGLRQTARDCKEQFDNVVSETILNNFYVDDCLKSVDTVDNAISLVHDIQEALHTGGFNIAKWISNSREVMSSIPISRRASEIQDLDLDQDVLPVERALGVQWCVDSDDFKFKVDFKDRPVTRRGILSSVRSIYDPLGFLAPVTLRAKCLLQELCKLKKGWDEPITESLSVRWFNWLQDVENLSNFQTNRCFKPHGFGTIVYAELHHFSDASESGYGTVSYLRLINEESKVYCSFAVGKARVAPLKQITIPRLELTAATVAVRTDRMLREELEIPISCSVFWTDSMSVLRYIRNSTSRFQTFVANRLSIIHEGSIPDQWHYINTKSNPADLASRGMSADNSQWMSKWITAPDFLWKSELKWTEMDIEDCETLENDPEVKQVRVRTVVTSQVEVNNSSGINDLINRHSSWTTLKRHVAWILKVRKELRRRVYLQKDKLQLEKKSTDLRLLSISDINEAEIAILNFIQRQEFAHEMETLQDGKSHVSRKSSIRKLDPIYTDGLLRVGGRLHESCMPIESKHPVILPKNHHVSILILRQIHHDLKHSGRNHILSKLREHYWVVNAPSAIRRLISKCIVCRRHRSSVGEQKMSDLPTDRVMPDQPPFTNVGVDYFGPVEVKQKRSHVKRYGVIFTCLASRAIHLEIAYSLDTGSYINALRRFIARRGQVTKIRSDNGSNFIGAEKELQRSIEEWNLAQIQKSMIQKNVDWQFNPPSGSHHGGVWERLIRSVRSVMKSVLKEQTLDDEGLHTLFCEIEAIINDRPVTKNSDCHDDLEALTPNHLLIMKRKPNLPPGLFRKTDNYCKRRWRQVQYIANLFRQRWIREYLPLLQERQKWFATKRNMTVGDIVLIVDSNSPRNSWPMGKVIETIPDRNGLVRQVKVKTKTNVLVRPVDKLCLLLEMDES